MPDGGRSGGEGHQARSTQLPAEQLSAACVAGLLLHEVLCEPRALFFKVKKKSLEIVTLEDMLLACCWGITVTDMEGEE